MKNEDKKKHFRIAVLGHTNVGKSALTVRYLTRRYIGEYRSKSDLLYRQTVNVQNNQLDVEIVDVSGETRDCECPSELIQWADACLLVYSITDRDSFDTARRLLTRLTGPSEERGGARQPILALLANKADLEHLRLVTEKEGRSIASENSCHFTELSVADSSEEVCKFFETVLLKCKNPSSGSPNGSNGNINKLPPYQIISQSLTTDNHASTTSTKSGSGVRKFSVSKMLGSLMGKHSGNASSQQTTGGTVVVCQRSDLYRNKVLQRRQNFMAAVSL